MRCIGIFLYAVDKIMPHAEEVFKLHPFFDSVFIKIGAGI